MEGVLPRNRLYLIAGDPGAGKTTLALQFLLEGARLNEKGLYITLSETTDELKTVAKSHGWLLDKFVILELSAIARYLKGETEHTFFHPSEVELNKTTKILMEEVDKVNPARVVFDSLSGNSPAGRDSPALPPAGAGFQAVSGGEKMHGVVVYERPTGFRRGGAGAQSRAWRSGIGKNVPGLRSGAAQVIRGKSSGAKVPRRLSRPYHSDRRPGRLSADNSFAEPLG